jgi:hypothetical protein
MEPFDAFLLMHFGFIGASGLIDHYTCAISLLELEVQKESLMEYLGKTGSLGDAPPPWQPPSRIQAIDLCNFIGVCGSPEIAEITLNNFVHRIATEAASAGSRRAIPVQPVALLRSSMTIHKHWIKMLYPS